MKKIITALTLTTSLLISPAIFAEVVNINKADAEEISKNLTGIGKKKAEAIVAYRAEFGAFKTLEEIKEVKGIGDGIFAKIRDDLSLGDQLLPDAGKVIETKEEKNTSTAKVKADKASGKELAEKAATEVEASSDAKSQVSVHTIY